MTTTYVISASVVTGMDFHPTGFTSTTYDLMNNGGFDRQLIAAKNLDEIREQMQQARWEARQQITNKCLALSVRKLKGRAATGFNKVELRYFTRPELVQTDAHAAQFGRMVYDEAARKMMIEREVSAAA
jgi:hypothetical protein